MHTFDTQSNNAHFDAAGRTLNSNNNINSNSNNNNSSSTGSNIVAPCAKNAMVSAFGVCSTTNVTYEVHDWWREQVIAQSSDEEDDE